MTTRLIQPKPSLRQQNLKWMNGMVHYHDIFCDCCTPLQHIIILILQQEPELDFKPIEKDLIRRCLGDTTTAVTATGPEEPGLEEGVLEDLFKESFGEDVATG